MLQLSLGGGGLGWGRKLNGRGRAATHPATVGGRPGPTQRPEDQGEEGERGVETVVGVSVIDAAADWSLGHAYTGTETKARLGGLRCGGVIKDRGGLAGGGGIAGNDIGGSSLLNRLQEESV